MLLISQKFTGAEIAWNLGMIPSMPTSFEETGSSQSIQSVGLLIVGIGFAGAVAGSIHGLFMIRLISSRKVESFSQ